MLEVEGNSHMSVDLGFSPERVDELLTANDEVVETFALFAMLVAGHSAKGTMNGLGRFFQAGPKLEGESTFAYVRRLDAEGRLEPVLKTGGFGNWKKNIPGVRDLASRSAAFIRTADLFGLMTIHGISWKTASFLLAYLRGEKVAVLDTHILQYLASLGYEMPKTTPQSRRKYEAISAIFFAEAEKRGTTPAALDLQIWTERSKYLGGAA